MKTKIYRIIQKQIEMRPVIGLTLSTNLFLYQQIRQKFQGLSERTLEYQWVLNNINLKSGRILDVGGANSIFPYKLSLNKKYEVYCLDLHSVFRHPVHNIIGDIRYKPLPLNYFDIITSISVIEHIGVGSYHDDRNLNGDITAVEKIRQSLKKSGKILFTMPFGTRYEVNDFERIYNEEKIKDLFKDFIIQEMTFFTLLDGTWRISNKHSAQAHSPSVVAIKAMRKQ